MTFITEWGRYHYCCASMGFHVLGETYTRRFDDITSGYWRVVRIVDHSLLWDLNIGSSFWHTFDYLKLRADSGVVFNSDIFQFTQEGISFAGFEMTREGCKPLKKIIIAIKDFLVPTCITAVRSWFGLANQLSYTLAKASIMEAFCQLLSAKTFFWDSPLEELFEKSKVEIEGVKTFEPNRPMCLATDWSRSGIGFNLTQKH